MDFHLADDFYLPYVIGGAGAFNMNALGFADFADAIEGKLEREIVPEPGAFALLILGAGLILWRRR